MHSLLEKLGREIVRKQSIHEPGQRSFLVDREEIREVLTGDAAGCKSVIGIDFDYYGIKEELIISERTFKGMPNLQFLRMYGNHDMWYLTCGLSYLSCKLRLLHWADFPMTSLPSIVNFEFLVELNMFASKLEKLWEGIKLKREQSCHQSIGNATNLEKLDLSNCSNLVELPLSIGNLQKLQGLLLKGCSKLKVLPANINLESLLELDLTNCSMLKSFPEISTNLEVLRLRETALEEVPPSIRLWSRLDELHMSYFENLKEFPHALDRITKLYWSDTEIQEVPPWVLERISRLKLLKVKRCRKLVSLPPSLYPLRLEACELLNWLSQACSFHKPQIRLHFANCFKLNQEARDLIIQTPISEYAVLPGREVPWYFTHRATSGGPVTIKLNERPLPTYMSLKACILLVNKGEDEATGIDFVSVEWGNRTHRLHPALTEHLYTFQVTEYVTSSELVFEFKLDNDNWWKIAECGIVQLVEVPSTCGCRFGERSVFGLPPF